MRAAASASPRGRPSRCRSRARIPWPTRDGAPEQDEADAEQDASVHVRPEHEQRQRKPDSPVGCARVACEQPHERGEERQRVRLRARRGRHQHEHHRAGDRGDPGRRATESACSGHRDHERQDEAGRVGEEHQRDAAERIEPVGRHVREPLLVRPGPAGRVRHQAVRVRQAVLDDVPACDEVEVRVTRDAEAREREQPEPEQQHRNREDRVRDRPVRRPHEARDRVLASRRLVVCAHADVIGTARVDH